MLDHKIETRLKLGYSVFDALYFMLAHVGCILCPGMGRNLLSLDLQVDTPLVEQDSIYSRVELDHAVECSERDPKCAELHCGD
jgi:hypothetical protein